MPNDASQLTALQQRLGYTFRQPALLTEALTHGSFIQELSEKIPHNPRLEFLGDSVLHFILTDALFHEFRIGNEPQVGHHLRREGFMNFPHANIFHCQLITGQKQGNRQRRTGEEFLQRISSGVHPIAQDRA